MDFSVCLAVLDFQTISTLSLAPYNHRVQMSPFSILISHKIRAVVAIPSSFCRSLFSIRISRSSSLLCLLPLFLLFCHLSVGLLLSSLKSIPITTHARAYDIHARKAYGFLRHPWSYSICSISAGSRGTSRTVGGSQSLWSGHGGNCKFCKADYWSAFVWKYS